MESRDRAKCAVCKSRINVPADPFCCQVCRDSSRAEKRRQVERLQRVGS